MRRSKRAQEETLVAATEASVRKVVQEIADATGAFEIPAPSRRKFYHAGSVSIAGGSKSTKGESSALMIGEANHDGRRVPRRPEPSKDADWESASSGSEYDPREEMKESERRRQKGRAHRTAKHQPQAASMGGHLHEESGLMLTPGGQEFSPELVNSFGAMTLNEIQSRVHTFAADADSAQRIASGGGAGFTKKWHSDAKKAQFANKMSSCLNSIKAAASSD